ncbi:MAG: glutamate--tRNA ligase family protein, partial [Candidatus Pacebacteria bacterium]|nr:glutamate--tRNA ligase family protein [Candidatus Paceibacterota bacterium]
MSNNNLSKVVTRFAPSPTGLLHGGNYRTAIFSYLFARKNGGKFILRIEDTDRERSKPEFEQNILESLSWLGLEYDEMHRQSELVANHTKAIKQMIESGHAYVSLEEAKDGSGAIRELVRFKNPNKRVKFTDIVRGEIEMDTTDLGDFIIAKKIDEPLFHLAVVVDDASMGVTHIIRGEDH